ncbi:MFS transporter [Mesorhizobium sp.]|uniref:MFS transporter n=1 Tax=Mesorhizobium sp. TaxID=1871066 RepID=UPI00345B1BDF
MPSLSDTVRIHFHRKPKLWSFVFVGFLASTLSASVGRNGYYIACAWILVDAGHGSAGVATMLAVVSIVELVSSPVAGLASDRLDRRWLNIAADLGRFALMFATACAMFHLDAFVTICLSAAVFAFCDRVALTASQSMIPIVVRGSDLATSNSTVFFAMQSGCLGAALLASSLLARHSPPLTFAVLAVFFFTSAASLSLTRLNSGPEGPSGARSLAVNIDRRLVGLFAVYALLYASAVLVSVMGSSFVFEEQRGTAADFGYLEAAWSAGSLIGAIVLAGVTRVTSAHTLRLVLLGSTAFALMALTVARSPWTLMIFAVLGFLYNLGRVSVEVTLQSRASDNVLGRAKGAMHSLAVGLGLVIFGVAAALGDNILPSTIFFGFGVLLIIGVSALSIDIVQRKNGT